MNSTAHEAKQINMTIDDFIAQFRPIRNPIDTNAAFEGTMFETFGAEVAYVKTAEQKNVWTILDSDGIISVAQGMLMVNRIGYLITEVPALDNTHYNIEDEDLSSDDE